jgi:hypothetical protein
VDEETELLGHKYEKQKDDFIKVGQHNGRCLKVIPVYISPAIMGWSVALVYGVDDHILKYG